MYSTHVVSESDFVAVDLEATGPTPGRNSIIEVGAARLRGGEVISKFQSLVRPTDSIPLAVEQLTGISSTLLVGAEGLDEVMTAFREFARGAPLVAHSYRFDLGFLDHESERLWGEPWPRPAIDTLCLARKLHPGLPRYSLASLAEHLDTPTRPTHRALEDALAAAEVFACMLPDLERIGVRTVAELATFCGIGRQSALASRLRLTSGLPDEPGVFVFRDGDGTVIYVGRAKSLHARTRSYFYPLSEDPRHDIGMRVESLSAVVTRSPLDAALLERRLMERYDPELNPSGQRARGTYILYADASPTPGLKVVSCRRKVGTHIGPFTSRWAAVTLADRLSECYGLRRCSKRIDARLAASACEYRDGRCPAPCVLPVDRVEYRARLGAALATFDGDGQATRERFTRAQQDAAADHRYEEAIRYRDGLRALDRALNTLRTVRTAADRNVIAMEENERGVIAHLIRQGMRASVVRAPVTAAAPRLERAMRRVYFSGAGDLDIVALSGPEIAELTVVAAFLASGEHGEIEVTDDSSTLDGVRRALGLTTRIPRRRHATTSAE